MLEMVGMWVRVVRVYCRLLGGCSIIQSFFLDEIILLAWEISNIVVWSLVDSKSSSPRDKESGVFLAFLHQLI